MNKLPKKFIIPLILILVMFSGLAYKNFYYDSSKEQDVKISSSNSNDDSKPSKGNDFKNKEVANNSDKNHSPEDNCVEKYYIDNPKKSQVDANKVPVLMYHSIRVKNDNPLMVSPEKFELQMDYLKKHGYYTLSLDELYDYFNNQRPIPEKSVVLTFDDGYKDNYTNLYPILKKYGFKGTVFVITGAIDKEADFLTSKQIKEMDANCLDIQSHTFAHDNLSKLSYEKQVKTLKDSRIFLEKKLNKKVKYIAYPFGKFNQETQRAAKDAGYSMAFTTLGKWSDKSDGILKLNRVYINGSFDIDTFAERVSNSDYGDKNNLAKIFWGQVTNFTSNYFYIY